MNGADDDPGSGAGGLRDSGEGLDPLVARRLRRDRDGLVCAVVQSHGDGEVLMVGWMDDEALRRTLTSGRVTFWSRSRQEYWRKGDTSGHAQWVRGVAVDCDGDALLVTVDQIGAACHTGARSCFDAGRLPTAVVRPGERTPVPPTGGPATVLPIVGPATVLPTGGPATGGHR